jgi:CBS domain-containing protein
MAKTARDIMTGEPECIGESETVTAAAKKMRDLDVGSLPICGDDDKLKGMLTDRDIVVRCLAEGGDPASTTAGSLAQGKPVTIGADDSVEQALQTMQKHQVKRLPVIDGHRMIGIISQEDIAQSASAEDVGETAQAISS